MNMRLRALSSAVLAALVVLMLPGCSTFKSTRKVDLTPFAQHLIAMSEDIQYGLSEERAVWLRRYAKDPEIVELLTEYRVVSDRTRRILRGILAYSIEIVTLAQIEAEGPEKAQALAGYLEHLKGPAIDEANFDIHMTAEKFDDILADMRTRKNLIDGINAAQPVADEIARITGEHISRVEVLQARLEEAITASIEEDHAPQLEFMGTLKETHALTLNSLRLLITYIDGGEEALTELHESDPRLRPYIPRGRKPTEAEITVLVDKLLDRLNRIEQVRSSIKQDLDAYEAELAELHRLTLGHKDAVRKARATALAWAQAHRKLASGVVDPAKIDLFGMARSAVKGAL